MRNRDEGTKGRRDEGIRAAGTSPRTRSSTTCAIQRGNKFEVRSSKFEKGIALLGLTVLIGCSVACVRRTITITTDPPNARVFLNDQEIGRSEVTTDFLWYGDYGVTIRQEDYETLQTNWPIKAPWYQWVPFDFFTEVLWPGQLHDRHTRHFVLEPAKVPSQDELISRAAQTRDRALETGK